MDLANTLSNKKISYWISWSWRNLPLLYSKIILSSLEKQTQISVLQKLKNKKEKQKEGKILYKNTIQTYYKWWKETDRNLVRETGATEKHWKVFAADISNPILLSDWSSDIKQ